MRIQKDAVSEDKKNTTDSGVSINKVATIAFVISCVMSLIMVLYLVGLYESNRKLAEYSHEYSDCDGAIDSMRDASRYLTSEARLYVETGTLTYMRLYYQECNVNQRRESAVTILSNHDFDVDNQQEYITAMDYSTQLEEIEIHAMKLAVIAYDQGNSSLVTSQILDYELPEDEKEMSKMQKLLMAKELLYSKQYVSLQEEFDNNMDAFHTVVLKQLDHQIDSENEIHDSYISALIICVSIYFVLIFFTFLLVKESVLKPLKIYMECIELGLKLPPRGSQEMQKMAGVFNEMYKYTIEDYHHSEPKHHFYERIDNEENK